MNMTHMTDKANTSSRYMHTSNRIAFADHTLSSDIDSLINKVNMNSTFTNLKRNDSELVSDMKTAIVHLYSQSKRREVLYVAIQHNTKYLSEMAQRFEKERDSAIVEATTLRAQVKKINEETDTMKRKFNSLQKDSEQLVQERKKITQLTLDLTKEKEKEEAATQKLKEINKKLIKSEKNLAEMTTDKEDFERKSAFLDEKLNNLVKEHTELKKKYENNAEDLVMLQG